MNTFLPYRNFQESAVVLDDRRLGKQRVEVLQLLKANAQGSECLWHPILGFIYGRDKLALVDEDQFFQIRPTPWYSHPCATMWRGYDDALVEYGLACCEEWMYRGFESTVQTKIIAYASKEVGFALPPWLGDPDFHRSHQSNLLRKDPQHYGPQFIGVPDDLPYVWPVGDIA